MPLTPEGERKRICVASLITAIISRYYGTAESEGTAETPRFLSALTCGDHQRSCDELSVSILYISDGRAKKHCSKSKPWPALASCISL